MFNSALQKKSRNLDDIDDVLIVRKITAKEPDNLPIEGDYEEEKFDWDEEQYLLAEEQEILLKKQLQLIQADERGKQALISEINAIKQRQEKRAQVLRQRQHALDIEKERAKKIAMLPPPLPASVKLLLRKNDNEPVPKKSEVQMPDELQVFHMKGAEYPVENKENILSPEEFEAKQRMQEECEKRAQKRFKEAIKKDRQKEEYSKVMKEIQNAELLNRREIAKSIISENKSIPCPLSDKFQMVQKQADIEEASEKIFKKMDKKEHVIEDIEGYQDSYEQVFGKIDSGFESKMMDCVPSFVKENYEYLLEDDSKFQGGKNFSGLDDSSDVLNEAYIENSPDYERLSEREKLDEAISHLDKLRTDIQTEYEQTFRPLLEAAISEQDASKKDTCDKAVEAKILKMPAEDKAVETEMPHGISADSPPLPMSNFLNSGVMFKRRYEWPRLGSYSKMFVPPMHQRNVHYSVPFSPEPERLTPTSWSSSSYCSLPIQHGIPASSSSSKSVNCDICIAEREKELTKSTATQASTEATPPDKVKSDSLKSSLERSKLSEYVKLLATKYLGPKPATQSQSDSALLMQSMAQSVNAAFEREVVPKFRKVPVTQHKLDEHPLNAVDKPDTIMVTNEKIPISNSIELSVDKDVIHKETVEEINDEKKRSDIPEILNEVSDYDEENTLRGIQQVLGRRMPRFALDSSSLVEKTEDRPQQDVPSVSGQCPVSARPHVFHELSTIQEMDSALTAESLQASRSKLSNVSAVSNENEVIVDGNLESSKDRFKMASLLDPPSPDVTDLAKSIHFVGEIQKEVYHPVREPPVVPSETQDSASVSLKKDSSKPLSFQSAPSVSNDSVKSASRPSHKDSRFLPDFSEGRDIHQKDSNSEISGVSSLTPGLFSSNLSSPFSLTGLSTPSMKTSGNIGSSTPGLFSSNLSSPLSLTGLSTPSIKSTGNTGSLESGYTNSPVFTTYQSNLCATDRKSNATSANSPAFSSIHFTPTMIDSKSSRNVDHLSFLKASSSGSLGKSDTYDSKKFQSITNDFDISVPSSIRGGGAKIQPMTFQSDISVPTVGRKGAEFQPMTPRSDFPNASIGSASHKFQSMTPQSNISRPTAGSEGSAFQPMTPQSNFPSPSVGSGSNTSQPMTPESNISVLTAGSEGSTFQPMTPRSDIPSPSIGSASNKFQPITPQSNISGPSARSDGSTFQPMTPRSDLPSPSVGNASTKFHPMTPQSNISGPTNRSGDSKFQPLIPQSVISDPRAGSAGAKFQSSGEKQDTVHGKHFIRHWKETVSSSSSESFAPLTPHSSISTPSEGNIINPDFQGYSKSAENFRALTPVSTISTPSLNGQEAGVIHKNASSGSSNFYPMKIRIDISSDSTSSKASSSNSINNFPHLNYRFTVKAPVPDDIQDTIAKSKNKVSGAPLTDSLDKGHFDEKTSSKLGAKLSAKVCQSGFFTPKNDGAELHSSERKQEHQEVKLRRDIDQECSKAEFIPYLKHIPFSLPAVSGTDFQKGLLKSKEPTAASAKDAQNVKKDLEEKFKDSGHRKNLWGIAEARGLSKPFGHLQLTSSASSSTENLSEISGSRVLHQSTPIKSAQQIAQEPGILEEPDLTLMTTEYSCMGNTTVKPHETLNAADNNDRANKKDKTLPSSLEECKTPTNQSIHLTGSAATPSMLSFLQHEISCEQTEEVTNTESMKLTPLMSESKTDSKQRQPTPQFPRSKYKERTKRLWNNLEEVRKKKELEEKNRRKKNAEEERRKFMAENRLKAKEYAKKFTPKRK